MSSVIIAGDTSGSVTLQAPNIAGSTTLTLPATSGNVLTSTSATVGSGGITFSDGSTQTAAASPYVLKNRIINGDMRIDQRNAGASVTSAANGTYFVDRWRASQSANSKFSAQQNAGAVTPPAGFTNYLGITSLSAYSVLTGDYIAVGQRVEGFNAADLAWGTANAKTVTLSFWVRSSLTGTFGGAVANASSTRSYPFTYTISAANTWELETVTIPGDTTGTWDTTNGVGIALYFNLGTGSTYSGTAGAWAGADYVSATGATSVVGTNGATFYITGVQLEIGSTATPFERRLYNQELANCQRYYYRLVPLAGKSFATSTYTITTTDFRAQGKFPVTMRISPTALEQSGTASNYLIFFPAASPALNAVVSYNSITNFDNWCINGTVSSGLTTGQSGQFYANSDAAYLGWSAEL